MFAIVPSLRYLSLLDRIVSPLTSYSLLPLSMHWIKFPFVNYSYFIIFLLPVWFFFSFCRIWIIYTQTSVTFSTSTVFPKIYVQYLTPFQTVDLVQLSFRNTSKCIDILFLFNYKILLKYLCFTMFIYEFNIIIKLNFICWNLKQFSSIFLIIPIILEI